MLGVAFEQFVREPDDRRDAPVCNAVVDDPVLAPRLDEAAPAETGEMVRDLRLAGSEQPDELADRVLALEEELEDPKPGGVTEGAKVLREDLRPRRLVGETEWSVRDAHRRSVPGRDKTVSNGAGVTQPFKRLVITAPTRATIISPVPAEAHVHLEPAASASRIQSGSGVSMMPLPVR